ncbi:hypothetical protein F993_01495 [Acinetobacter proteolyticus]|uniref:Tape measure protein N-terminal domain-containing protein n=1 Tax=Acinetobacter proteolyticus TaxID=1776741 RepID=A0ABN0JGB4_9GAMM|nr:tape measure protein [Acinetobacter proteolyticus]ENU24179.1 hypothetical protein F993_01495 [Acinetobacter proteolyticus]
MIQESRLVIVIDSRNAARNARNLSDELNSIERNGDFATRSTDRLSVATRQLAGYMAGLVTIGAAVSKMDTYTGLQNRLKLVTNSQTELNQAMKDTFSIAQSTGQAWESTAQVYQRFADNAKRLGITLQQTASLTDTVAKAIAISGGSAASAEAALVQFGQALASGVLRGEEFNSISEQAPGLLKAIATGLDSNIGQLRKMAAEGQLTADVVIKSLEKAKLSVDDLFGKTDFTIANSFTMLNNAVIQFVGEAGKGSGAAKLLSGSLQSLAQNMEPIINIAVIGGVALLTKMILSQTVAVKTAIGASLSRRAAQAAEAEGVVRLAALEVQRLRQVTALAAQEVSLARLEYNSATTRNVRAAATIRLTQAEIAHRIALNQTTAAIAANTAAQNALNASRAIGSRLLALVGGPIGAITLGVTALAAGYMYLQGRTEAATKKLQEQGKVADKTREELLKLQGVDRKSATIDLTTAFDAQNKALEKSRLAVGSALIDIQNYEKGNWKVIEVINQANKGTISYSDAIKQLNDMKVSPELYNALKKQVEQYDANYEKANKSATALKIYGIEVELTGSKAQNAALKVKANTDELNLNSTAAERATLAQKGYFDSLRQDVLSANERLAYMNLGFGKEVIDQINKLQAEKQKALGDGVTAIVTDAEIKEISLAIIALDAVKQKENEITESKRNQTKELEKQAKLSHRLIGISGNSGIGTGAHLDVRYGGSRDGQKVSKEHLARLQAGGKALSSYRVSSDYGQRKAPTAGASSFHKGIDFAMPVGTPITTTVAVKDVKTAYDAKGGGYYSTVTFEDGVVLKLLHQAPSMMSKVKGGPSDGTYKSNLDLEKQANEVARNQIQLQMAVADEITRIRQNLADDLKEIDKAGYSDDEARKLKAQYQVQANNDIAIAQQAIRTRLDDYKAFTKTEEQLLRDSFARRQFEALHDLELTKSQRQEAVNLLSQQEQQELALIKLSQEQRLYQSKLFLLSESEAIRERYRLERKEIEKTTKDEDERRKRLALSREQERLEQFNKAAQASKNWGSTYTEMTGNNQLYQLDQTRQDRTSQSLAVADSQNADVMTRTLDPNADIEALAAEQEAIWQAHRDRMALIDQDYWSKTSGYQLGMASDLFGSLTGLAEGYAGKQSGIYRGMAAAQHAFSLFSVAANSFTAISSAWASAPFPANLPAVGTATLETGLLQAALKALSPQGFATGGYTGDMGRGDIAGVVHGQEYVLNAAATKRVGVDTLNAINSGRNVSGASNVIQPQVVINNNAPTRVSTQTGADGKLYVTVDEVEQIVAQSIARPSSPISKSFNQNTNAGRRR